MSTLLKLHKIEDYVRAIFNKLSDSVVANLEETVIKITRPYTVTSTGTGIVTTPPLLIRITDTELKKQMLLLDYSNLVDSSNTSSLEAYQAPASLSTNTIGLLSTLSYNNVDALVLPAASSFSIPTSVNKVFFPSLKYILGQFNFGFSTSGVGLNEISMPELEYIDLSISIPSVISLNSFTLPKLKVGGVTNNNTSLTTLSLPEVIQLSCSDTVNSSMTAYSFPKLKTLRSLIMTGTKANLTTISLPVVEWVNSITFPTVSTALTSFTFGSSLKGFGVSTTNFVTTSNSLDQASVDNILISFAALDGYNGTAFFGGRTVTITGGSATPSAAGLAAKAILVSRACTVTTN